MKKQKGSEVIVAVIYLVIVLAVCVGWVKNLIKLTDCDFEAPYKAEVIHAVGIIPVVGTFTGWMDFGK